MLKARLEELIRDSLAALGGEELERSGGVSSYRLGPELARHLGREELRITFSAGVAAHSPDVELISAGSYLYDLILRLVRESGRSAMGWLPADPGLDAPAAIRRAAARQQGRRFSRIKRAWGSTFLFSFRLGFHFDTPHEKLLTIRVDLERGRVRPEPHLWSLLDAARPHPPEGAGPGGRVQPEKAFRLAWERVEEEVARLTEKYRRQGLARQAEDLQTIEHYYRQLIEEEKRSREQRHTRRARNEAEERIELLKLEWDRRIAEEQSRLLPAVSVSLSCAACLRVPLEKWRAHPEPGRRDAADFWVDAHSGDVWPAQPPGKTARSRRPPRLRAVPH